MRVADVILHILWMFLFLKARRLAGRFSKWFNHQVSGLIARELHEKRQGASFCLMTACWEKAMECTHPQGFSKEFLENPPENLFFFPFPRFFGRLASRPKAVLTMTQNIIQEQKDEARRIVEEQVACYIGCLDEGKRPQVAVSTFMGTWERGESWLMLVVEVEEMQSSRFSACFFSSQWFLHLIVLCC